MKSKIKILVIWSLLIIITSCNSNGNHSLEKVDNNNTLNHILVSGKSTDLTNTIADMIKMSDIRGGGYVVIIPTPDLKKDNNSQKIKNTFYQQQIMAIHIINLSAITDIKNSEVIALENATIICLLGDKSYKLRRILKNKKVVDAFKAGYSNGALITGIGTASSTICENYLWFDENSNDVSFEPGLALLKNTIIEDSKLLIRHMSEIQKLTTDSSYVFVGMSSDASIYIAGPNGVILNGSTIDVFSSFDNIRKLKKNDSFKLPK